MTHACAAPLQVICSKAHAHWDLKKIVLAHRTGLVAIGEASVIIAVSSAHRKEALEVTACPRNLTTMMAGFSETNTVRKEAMLPCRHATGLSMN